MATGIVSIAATSLHMAQVAWALFQINKAAYAALVLLTAVRVGSYWPCVVRDLSDHARGAGFLTVVASSCMLGSQYVELAHEITLDQMRGFTLYMIKAVLNGRGDEISDLARTNLFR